MFVHLRVLKIKIAVKSVNAIMDELNAGKTEGVKESEGKNIDDKSTQASTDTASLIE